MLKIYIIYFIILCVHMCGFKLILLFFFFMNIKLNYGLAAKTFAHRLYTQTHLYAWLVNETQCEPQALILKNEEHGPVEYSEEALNYRAKRITSIAPLKQ